MFSLGHKSLRSLRGNREGEIGEGNERVRNSRREGSWEGRNNMRETWLVTIQNSSLVTTHMKSPIAQLIVNFSVPNSVDPLLP